MWRGETAWCDLLFNVPQTVQLQGPDAAINQLDANGCTPLMYAVMADSKLGIEMLLNFGTKREQVHMYMCVCGGGGGG